jgi:hypothetical protein
MRPFLAPFLAALAVLLATAPAAGAETVRPRSAAAFADSVGVATHIVYYSTAYGDWPRAVARLEELGVRHLRDGVYGNPSAQWRAWNERYYRAVELASSRGMRFLFGMGRPGSETGTIDQLAEVVARFRHAADGLEAPNEFDHFVGGPGWTSALRDYQRRLYRRVKGDPRLRGLRVVGPSFKAPASARRVGDQRALLDVGNIHPYTGGRSPSPSHLRTEMARAAAVSARKPVWATEAGFHNATRATTGQPGVSEAAAAVYLVRTFLEHFRSGIPRTYAYELLDQTPERARRDPERHFGLLRHDFSPKPAFTALKRLLAVVGRDRSAGSLRPVGVTVSGAPRDLRRLVLRRRDGTYVVALWRQASVWDTAARRALRDPARRIAVRVAGATTASVTDPVAGGAARRLVLRRGRAALRIGAAPLLLQVRVAGDARAARARAGR